MHYSDRVSQPLYCWARDAATICNPPASPMREVNERMTVKQMIDLVSFLQPQYTQRPPPENLEYYTL